MASDKKSRLILHTGKDGSLFISHAEQNLAWSGSSWMQLVRFPMGNQNSILPVNLREYLATVEGFVRSLQ